MRKCSLSGDNKKMVRIGRRCIISWKPGDWDYVLLCQNTQTVILNILTTRKRNNTKPPIFL